MKFSEVKEYARPYVIAELGSNHNGDMDLARKLIDSAVECGADCVKFQSWTKKTIFSQKVYDANYFLEDDYRNREDYTLEEIVEKFQITKEQHFEMKEYCKEKGIEFASTPFSRTELDFLVDEIGVPFIKIASMDMNNIPFLRLVAKKNKPVAISVGLCPLSDVALGIETLLENGCEDIVLLHCVSIYPPADEQVNLNNIDMLRQAFGLRVGYSDHTVGTVAPVMSIAKGVCIIEKHFTLDKEMFGWDHKISADPSELRAICHAAKCGYKMLGSYKKVVNEDVKRRDAFQRSIVAAKPISRGQVIREEDIDYKRPGSGIPPKYFEFIVGRTAKKDIAYDEQILMEDF